MCFISVYNLYLSYMRKVRLLTKLSEFVKLIVVFTTKTLLMKKSSDVIEKTNNGCGRIMLVFVRNVCYR